MLENSFIHLPGIGATSEQKYWDMGLCTWRDLLPHRPELEPVIQDCEQALELGQYDFFQKRLPVSEMWRMVPTLIARGEQRRIAYLDIETTGLGFPPKCKSTTIAILYDGNLHVLSDKRQQMDVLAELNVKACLLVTFNGSTFDLPFLRREFGLPLARPHLDLRHWLARLDYRGGLKAIQKRFPEIPQRLSLDIDGYDAVRLWRLHQRGVPGALETLMTYNAEDTIVLESLMYCALNLEAERRSALKLNAFQIPQPARVATHVWPEIYQMLRSQNV